MKKTKKITGLAIVRGATGLSQQKFGTAIGTTKSTIDNIERGTPITAEMAEDVATFTGAVPWTLSGDDPRDFNNKPYTAQSWEKWRKCEFDEEEFNKLRAMSHAYLQILLKAAAHNSAGQHTSHVFRSVLLAFNRFISQENKKYGLRSRIDAVMQELFGKSKQGETTVEKARFYFRRWPQWKANEKAKWKPKTRVFYKQQSIPQLVPFVGFWKFNDGTPAFMAGGQKDRHIFDFDIEGHQFRVVEDKINIELTMARDPTLDGKPPASEKQKGKA